MHTPDAPTSIAPQPAFGPECPSLVDLASFIDEISTENQARLIDLHLVECELCRAAVIDVRHAREEQDSTMVFVPQAVIEAALALVGDRSGHGNAIRSPQRIFVWRSAAVAAALAIALGGHYIGLQLAGSGNASPTDLDTELTFGLIDSPSQSDPELDLFALALAEASG